MQRFKCLRCSKSFSETQPLDGTRIERDKAIQVIGLLVEGTGIRATSRLTGLDQGTILRIVEAAGDHCGRLLDAKIRNVNAENVQSDELHCFVGCKAQNTTLEDTARGDYFTYLSVDRETKLIINWRSSKRSRQATYEFLQDLKSRLANRIQLTTDCYSGYCGYAGAVREVFTNTVDYATETKVFGKVHPDKPIRFNPMKVLAIKRRARLGKPDLKLATTCHVERTNLSVRLFNRRFTRCTLGYSKKAENLRFSTALFIAHFNFCREHSAHKQTPAVASGLTDHTWTIEELISAPI